MTKHATEPVAGADTPSLVGMRFSSTAVDTEPAVILGEPEVGTDVDPAAEGLQSPVLTKSKVSLKRRKIGVSVEGAASVAIDRKAIIGSSAMGLVTVVCLVALLGGAGVSDPGEISQELRVEAFGITQATDAAKRQLEVLPDGAGVERALSNALLFGESVAESQNEYSVLTAAIAEAGGLINERQVAGIRRNLSPRFAQTAVQSSVRPWYLLAADVTAPVGTGTPMSFVSGFTWTVEQPFFVNTNGTVTVVWQAFEKFAAQDAAPGLLAQAEADFDPRTKTFGEARVDVTTFGRSLQLEVLS